MAIKKEKEKIDNTGAKILELVDKLHEERKIAKDVIFKGIASAIQVAAERHFQVEEGVFVSIDEATGHIVAKYGDQELDPITLGRIAAQSAKQMIIQKIREAESDTVYNEFTGKKYELLVGTVTRVDAGTAIVSLGKSEALLPRSEQIPGETHHVGERVKAIVMEVRKQGNRVKIVLSRAHPEFVKALFEEEIPEIDERIIDIRAVAREAGYRSKVAVTSIDMKVDAVGACVGVRGSRIKNVIEELNGERIDIVRWNDALQVLIPNALQPAQISDVFTYPRLGRAIVLVTDDQLSLAIGRRGQNVRLASKLVGWDIEIMTHDELAESLERAERWFGQLPNASLELTNVLIEEGFLSYNDITCIDAAGLAEFSGLPEDQADEVVMYAEEYADVMEQSVEDERRQAEEQARVDAEQAQADAEAQAAEGGDGAEGAAAETGEVAEGAEGLASSDVGETSEVSEPEEPAIVSNSSEETETPAPAPSDAEKPAE
ncbi:transcription termination factor : NusA antitermination factor OS=Planctomyces brasiliensis (strain ATCC 49424 / DSM 5305 / JCM 21570 / NBRC 103401 / IFAM 1448) GN=Plabr_3541 PE=3 SV=1: NusA_N: NusA_N: S1: KH_5 [Gemmata massiliana]|uniref:Transcription termination/antitermination protein NusA n=1 Tax=Gemmata massiliana TaxID=1210884 RepID=A0A6P2DL00_9BACT|nr:transcription termination factor NusA [Gemmata massiliana]VTS03722.1 transcription termination factor : NusA antitermination factor OS=Planctomyces brasiliensis (strain ATCC 49424 / DSM 5305 / JCM 21570 / NBRC 103401 / IFAM 1448) GN=Plabr_3541 PE=3 SV=1: NusA_N: NusA_N: S1: KH_5 [Gemmata massiliana]